MINKCLAWENKGTNKVGYNIYFYYIVNLVKSNTVSKVLGKTR